MHNVENLKKDIKRIERIIEASDETNGYRDTVYGMLKAIAEALVIDLKIKSGEY
jgi:hypothetical protein